MLDYDPALELVMLGMAEAMFDILATALYSGHRVLADPARVTLWGSLGAADPADRGVEPSHGESVSCRRSACWRSASTMARAA
jgi:hypothetical protein